MKPLISILVPMYNCEKKIRRCLDSLIKQQPSVFEAIVLDDGSTDRGYEVVLEYEKEYGFIHAYHQQNAGVAAARQKLLELAQGQYLMFCDADDFFEPDAVAFIYHLLNSSDSGNAGGNSFDAIIYGYNLVREHMKRTVCGRQLKEGVHPKKEFARLHVNGLNDLYWSSLWNKCYKAEICRAPQAIQYEKSIEDVMFNVDYLSRCRNIYVARKPFYNYVQVGESLTRTNSVKNVDENALEEAYQVYMTLHGKVACAYPEQKEGNMKNTYYMMKKLAAKASRIKGNKISAKLLKEVCGIKKEMGVKVYFWDGGYVMKKILQSIKAAARRFL